MVPRLLIMCGTSGVGKSTMSANLASSLSFGKIVSTDTIREVLRTQISSTESPALHRSSFESAGGSASEDWKETVRALSEGVLAVIERAASKGSDLLLEGVHYVPNNEVIDLWREAGGVATGVVLYVSSEDRHRGMIANRERHNGKKLDHYLGNMDRIRGIQEELVLTGSEIDWLVIDPTKEPDSIGLISSSLC
ncbi:MAG: AAA family ATPase [Candidatus Thalassarchaeaceae archaeon]